uniref:Protein-tyrosine phosphatase, receptor/non-receptor type domain-containing protein n=1 Tax=Strongyloides venezuelensis TaxID=75913 RepID=A0A0K0FAK0_STRVS
MNRYNIIFVKILINLFLYIQLRNTTNRHLYAQSQNLNNYEFPKILNITTKTDLIILKCPGSDYTNEKGDRFTVNPDEKYNLMSFKTQKFVWIYHLNIFPYKKEEEISCGKLKLNNTQNEISWIYKLTWLSNSTTSTKQLDISSKKYIKNENRCSNTDNYIILLKNENENINEMSSNNLNSVYKDDLIYVFNQNNDTNEYVILEPCVIYVPIHIFPNIEIRSLKNQDVISKNKEFVIIKKDFKKEKFDIKLVVPDLKENKDFYSYENVNITKLQFNGDGSLNEIGNKKLFNKSITVEGYTLLRIEYNCDYYINENGRNVSFKNFYFGPMMKNYVEKLPEIINNVSKPLIKPNCSKDKISFGFLYAIKFGQLEIKLVDLKKIYNNKKYNFELSENSVTFTNETYNGVLQCIYYTPDDGIYILQTTFKGYKNSNLNHIHDQRKVFIVIITISIIIFLVTVIIITIILIYKKKIKIYINKRRQRKIHSNIFKYWKKVQNLDFIEFANMLKKEQCIPEDIIDRITKIVISGGQLTKNLSDCINTDTLVKSQLVHSKKISANYVTSVAPSRTYILSEPPIKNMVPQFWEMIYEEKVRVIIAFVHNKHQNYLESFEVYWPSKERAYGNINVINCSEKEASTANSVVLKFHISKSDNIKVPVTIFCVNSWKENTIPENFQELVKLYDEVSYIAETSTVLVHSGNSNGSRTFLFVFFAGIVESFTNNKDFNEPMEIIKMIKNQKYGGFISTNEFVFLIFSVIQYFVEKNYLLESEDFFKYIDKFNTLIYEKYDFTTNNAIRYKNPLKFFVTLDFNNLNCLVNMADKAGRLSEEEIKEKCKRTIKLNSYEKKYIKGSQREVNRNRYPEINCLDEHVVDYNISTNINNPFDTIAMSNDIIYKNGKNIKRRLIMMQAPMENMFNAYIDLLYRNNVAVIIAINNCEGKKDNQKFDRYWPINNEKITYGNYVLGQTDKYVDFEKGIDVSHYFIYNSDNRSLPEVTFMLLRFKNWPDKKSIPPDHTILCDMKLYGLDEANDRPLVIHCNNGIGKTGTVAYALYMMDNISEDREFNPIQDLTILRQHRLDAVQTRQQFLVALLAVAHYCFPDIYLYDKNGFNNIKKLFTGIIETENKIDERIVSNLRRNEKSYLSFEKNMCKFY